MHNLLSPLHAALRRWLTAARRGGFVALLVLAPTPGSAAPPAALELSASSTSVDAWPAVSVLSDPSHTLSLGDVLARRADFVRPDVPRANFGVRHDAIWLRVPLRVGTNDASSWILDIDYASLDRVDVHLVSDSVPMRHIVLGRSVPFAQRPLQSHSMAAALTLAPGQAHELLIRIDTRSSAIVPLSLIRPDAFHAREARDQLFQGLLAGVGLSLLLYSLAQWVSLRDPVFVQYAIAISGTTLFFFTYFGLAAQHLWPGNAWLSVNAAPLLVLIALVGGFAFIESVLGVRETSARLAFSLRACALAALAAAAAFVAGLIDYRVAQLAATVLGPMPMLLAVPAAVVRSRGGDRGARYILVGWAVYGVGTLTMAGLLRGLVPSNFWTQHLFQFGALFEMVLWLIVLGVRVEAIRSSAQRAHLERDALRSLAHSDPLTGLLNRRGLTVALQAALPVDAAGPLLAVYLLDLDGFKRVNDRFGHDAGDALLVAVADRLKAHLRTNDRVARIGGDEFVLLAGALPGDAEARQLGRKLLDAFDAPFDVAGQACCVGLTIGYALAPLDGNDGVGLLRQADAAMYAGKQAGRHCLRRAGASASDATGDAVAPPAGAVAPVGAMALEGA